AYLASVILRGVQLGEDYTKSPEVTGEVKNTGDRALNTVFLTIYLLDKNEQPIAEQFSFPISASKFGNVSPLKSGYSMKFKQGLYDTPSDWAGKVRVEVTDIGFLPQEK
ncbi:MAG: hypothetical protein IH935_11845, partial [Acidobacteria bacterium]|nr:hypothetical protein [Acidobacteriota bacterium]